MKWILSIVLLQITAYHGVYGNCELPTTLHGTWESTNFGTVTIQSTSPHLSMTQTFTGASGTTTDFNCLLIDGSNYVLQSNQSVTVFSGTTNIYIYMCISFNETSNNTVIYYLNSGTESGLNNYRLVGLPISTSVTQSSQVCTATIDIAEYNTMVNTASTGYELGTVQCPTPLLGNFLFNYTNGGTTYCDTVNATLNTCNNQSLTSILVNDSACDAANPYYSIGGVLGCVASLFNSDTSTYYTTLYNGDTTVDNTATYRFSCVAITSDANGTVYQSISPIVCDSAQSSTVAPSPGALMVMTPDFTCKITDVCVVGEVWLLVNYGVPEEEVVVNDDSKDYTVLIVLLCVFGFLLIIFIIIVVLCYCRYKKKKKEKSREKKMLVSEDHPLGEVSIALDTPATMEPVLIESRHEAFRSPRRKKSSGSNPLGESSMNLDFTGGKWSDTQRPPSRMNMDPFTEMESGAIVPLSPYERSKTTRSLKSRQGSFVGRSKLNGDVGHPLAIMDSKQEEPYAKSIMNGSVASKRGHRDFGRGHTLIKARSIRSARSIKAPSVTTESLKTNGAVVRVSSRKGKDKPASVKPYTVTRSATSTKMSTRIGSVTRKSAAKRNMMRSQTIVVPTKTIDGKEEENTDQVHDFMAGEMQNGEALSSARSDADTARSKKSTKSAKSKSMTARSSGPSRSIMKQSSSIEKRDTLIDMTEEVMAEPEPFNDRSFMSRDLNKESFRTARELREMRLRAKKPLGSKGPWK